MGRFFLFLGTFFGVGYLILSYFSTPQTKQIEFYYWKQTYNVDPSSKIKPLYVKILDIENQKDTIKIHKTIFQTKPNATIIPVIYIENRVFLEKNLDAKTIFEELVIIAKNNHFDFESIQVDCDWSPSTKDKYFAFLKTLKTISQKQISITIRLHQLKYQQTGVPPADSGVLMYYNMGDFLDIKTKNYILDNAIGKTYLNTPIKYPLKLSLALPLYTQAVVMRYNKVLFFIDNPKPDLRYFKPLGEDKFIATKEHFWDNKIIYEGDIIRLDTVEISELQKAKEIVWNALGEMEEVIFFRYDNLGAFTNERLAGLINQN